MELKAALKEQYHGGLKMLAACIEPCPDELWTAPNPQEAPPAQSGNPRWWGVERPYWRIAFHCVFFTQLYLGKDEAAFQLPSEIAIGRREEFVPMWQPPWPIEPFELPTETRPATQSEILEYVRFLDALIDPTVHNLDLDSPESGFHWYKNITKLSHQMMNLRHLQGHVGQLSELLMQQGIDIPWIAKSSAAT